QYRLPHSHTRRSSNLTTVHAMKFPGAPYGLKMACGENPEHAYGDKGRFPSSRMGNFAGYREAWIKALEYKRKWEAYERGEQANRSEEHTSEVQSQDHI